MEKTEYKKASEVKIGDQLIADDGEPLKVKKIEKGVTVGGICFVHSRGHSEVHKDVRVEIKLTQGARKQ